MLRIESTPMVRLALLAAALMVAGAPANAARRMPQVEGGTARSAGNLHPTPQRQILILAADDFTRPWIRLIVDGFQDVMMKESNPPVLYFESIDASRFDDPDDAEALRTWLGHRYRNRHLDLIVPLGEPALRFLAEEHGEPWPHTAVLYVEVGGVNVDTARYLPNAEGLILENHFEAALRVVKQILPATERIALIYGTSSLETDRWNSYADLVRGVNLGLEPMVLAGLSMEDILSQVAHLPERTVLYILAPTVDAQGQVLPQALACELISAAANRPSFSLPLHDLGCGSVGGLLLDFRTLGRLTGDEVLRKLARTPTQHVTPPFARYTTLAFDARQLARWHIEERSLPAGSAVLHRQPSLWREHRTLITVAALVAALQAVLIGGLLIEHHRRRGAEVTSRQHFATIAHLDRRAAMGELTASLAHELNQPLNAILQNAGAAEMLLARMATNMDLDEIKEILADIRKDDVRAGEIIHRMRGLLYKRELHTQSLDLNDVARDTIALVSPDAAARHVRVETDLDTALEPIAGDRIHLQQVLLNLMLNGMEAMSTTPRDRRALLIRTSQRRGMVEVAVRDSGIGLSDVGATQKLFEPFYTTKTTGMGMGLSIARSIIEAHAGRIDAQSNSEGGATFAFRLKASRVAHEGIPHTST